MMPSQSRHAIEPAISKLQKFQRLIRPVSLHDNPFTMNVASVGRPVGCLKSAFRRARYQKSLQRCLSTAAATPARPKFGNEFSARQRLDKEKVSKFEIWPQVPSIRTTHPDPMPALREKQIAKLDPTGARTRLFSREHADSAKVGDVLMVSTKQGEPFAGAFIQIRRRGQDTAILLRGQMMKVGVEMWFKIYSPTTTGIDIIWRRPKRARRARLTYMRKPSHDMGSVDQLVFAWKKERYSLRSRAGAKPQVGQKRK
ncbi:Fc.00g109720.m01.CDS01 [Cosmosporella sp. VM-42]